MIGKRWEDLAGKALEQTRGRLRKSLPVLSSAMAIPKSEWTEEQSGTDGADLYWNPKQVCCWYAEDPRILERRYLHLIFHGMYLHSFRKKKEIDRIWSAACDFLTEYRIDRLDVPGFERPIPAVRSRFYRKMKEAGCRPEEHRVAKWLAGFTEEELSSLEEIFSWDDHSRWRGSLDEFMEAAKVSPEPLCPEQLKEAIHTVHRWRTAFEQLEQRSEEHKRQAGGSAGSQAQQVILEQEQGYDYRQFLRRFMTSREELMLDVDSFDLIPYDYSRRMYERLVLMEPLEYKEVHKLEELVIAIDTSGSCSGAIVRNFLEETGAIFRERDAFFQKVNIHLLQCDCLIQEHVCITCEANWEEYLNHLEVKGHGDTDFTPVFDLVDRMLEEGAFRNLKGLLYFTDGDGIYPTKQPIYETAFVFLNQELQKGKVPDWAISLTIDKELETGR